MTKNVNKLKDEDVQDLTNSLYLINGLYDQLSNERDHLTNAAGKIVNATKQFQGYIEKFADQGEQITVSIRQALYEESDNIAKMLVDKTHKEITDQTNKTLRALEASIKEARERLNDHGRRTRLFSRWFLAFMLAAAIIGGLSGGVLVRHHYTAIDEETRGKLQNGELLAKIWPKLTKEERERFKRLLRQ